MRTVVENHYPWDDAAQRDRVLIHFEHAKVIVLDGTDIGLWKTFLRSDAIELVQIQISPPYQGKGIGQRLIRDLQAEAWNQGLPIELHVFRSNRAVRLYASLGFRPVKEDENSFSLRWLPQIAYQNPRGRSSP